MHDDGETLWLATVTVTFPVAAPTPTAAESVARRAVSEEADAATVTLRSIASRAGVPVEFRRAIPWRYGPGNDNRTCGEIASTAELEAAGQLRLIPGEVERG